MENVLYRLPLGPNHSMELQIGGTNETNPVRPIKEMHVWVVSKHPSFDELTGEMNLEELDSLIDYLERCRQTISDFNDNSKPIQE